MESSSVENAMVHVPKVEMKLQQSQREELIDRGLIPGHFTALTVKPAVANRSGRTLAPQRVCWCAATSRRELHHKRHTTNEDNKDQQSVTIIVIIRVWLWRSL